MSEAGSISRCIAALTRGDRDGAERIWACYCRPLAGLARGRLRAADGRAADEEDVALSAFDSVCRGVERGRFPRLDDRNGLWRLMVVITVRKAGARADRERRPRRGGGQVRLLSELDPEETERVLGAGPTPARAAQAAGQCRRLLDLRSDDSLRRVVLRKLEGCTNAEVAAELGYVEATVERKPQRIGGLWSREGRP